MTHKTGHSMLHKMISIFVLWGLWGSFVRAEDGYRLWLRYEPIADSKCLEQYRKSVSQVVLPKSFQDGDVVRRELQSGLSGLLGIELSAFTEIGRAHV
jgi:alpha-glucuronidase